MLELGEQEREELTTAAAPKLSKRGVDLTYPEALSNRLTGVFSHVFPHKSLSPLRVNAKWC